MPTLQYFAFSFLLLFCFFSCGTSSSTSPLQNIRQLEQFRVVNHSDFHILNLTGHRVRIKAWDYEEDGSYRENNFGLLWRSEYADFAGWEKVSHKSSRRLGGAFAIGFKGDILNDFNFVDEFPFQVIGFEHTVKSDLHYVPMVVIALRHDAKNGYLISYEDEFGEKLGENSRPVKLDKFKTPNTY